MKPHGIRQTSLALILLAFAGMGGSLLAKRKQS